MNPSGFRETLNYVSQESSEKLKIIFTIIVITFMLEFWVFPKRSRVDCGTECDGVSSEDEYKVDE